ncbi:MAG: NAD(P)H-dependent oxidoreductase [Pontiellaceae bacterium]|nr:NAD(P)H-dependent oxidoreductase [Pontiellaceae bacterium]MBN2783275.1 NAD(P)H-dependent oxidoreductase [Pontiellaceae bacterium]
MKKILAFAGSNASNSINRKLLEYAADQVRNAEITLIDLREFDAPIYSEELQQTNGFPQNIQQLRRLFDAHDAFMIASPEHNGMMPAFFKNIIDWISRMDGKIFQDKPVFLTSTAPGPGGGRNNLATMRAVVPHWGASAVYADFYLPAFHDAFDAKQNLITDLSEDERLKENVTAFENHLLQELVPA